MENVETAPAPSVDDDVLACTGCGRLPDDELVWRVYWDVAEAGCDLLSALCPACARAELDD